MEFIDAPAPPVGLQDRCRLVMIICDVERMDQIEARETVLEVGGERGRKRGEDGSLIEAIDDEAFLASCLRYCGNTRACAFL